MIGLTRYIGITGVAHLGARDVLDGPFDSKEEALREGMRTNCPFDTYEWATRDRTRATQIYKRELLQKVGDLGESLQRVSHQMPGIYPTPG